MSVCIALEKADEIGPDLKWPLRIAAQSGGELQLLAPGPEEMALDLSGTERANETAEMVAALRAALDNELGEDGWLAAADAKDAARDADGPLSVRARLVPEARLVDAALGSLPSGSDNLLVVVFHGIEGPDSDWEARRRQIVTGTSCRIAFVRPGQRHEEGEVLVATSRGTHARAAVRMAAGLARAHNLAVTGLYVEPDIGADAERVGRSILDRSLTDALEHDAGRVRRRVEIDDRPADGVIRVAQQDRYELVVLGSSRLNALGARTQGMALRVEPAIPEPTVVVVRGSVPIGSRLRRWLDSQLQKRVPQLARGDRVELVARVQAQSQWNFDYVLLMGLSSLIAALGLLDDSAAVIIGAMLVAPLMTPLLGLGVSLCQGNPRLARMATKAVVLSFLTAFALALAAGLLSRDFVQATDEMNARHWPQSLHLAVAFLGGLAAAYASGRPGLLAALPGVAIAAALVPPIATAGLAAAIRDYDLMLGALLLFTVNAVAIVLASAVALWAMGLRQLRKLSPMATLAGAALTIATVGMALGLAISPPRIAPPLALVRNVESKVAPDHRLRDIRLHKEAQGWVVEIDLGGGEAPSPALGDELLQAARVALGADVAVRLTYRYERLVE